MAQYITRRLNEPSTWAGLGLTAVGIQQGIEGGLPWWLAAIMAVGGSLSAVMKERGKHGS